MKKRTNVDFSNHIIEHQNNELVDIHYIKKPNTVIDGVKFINAGGILSVTGDYGNWIFSRGFVPSKEGDYVSDQYWCEKLKIASTQNPYEFDENGTRIAINQLREENSDDDTYLMFLNNCEANLESSSGEEYRGACYDDLPSNYDHESIPYMKKTTYWLQVVFDAYDEIVNRYKHIN